MDTLQVIPISQANAIQRSGRAGRTTSGICYRLYTKLQYNDQMLTMNIPEIQRTNLSNMILLLKSLQINNLFKFPFIDPPSKDILLSSQYELWMLNAIDQYGHITTLGKKMILFPLHPILSKMLIYAEQYHCTNEIVTIVSMLSIQGNIFQNNYNKSTPQQQQQQQSAANDNDNDNNVQPFIIANSDYLTLLYIYQQCKKIHIQYIGVININ